MSFRPCLLITHCAQAELLVKYLPRLYDICPRILVPDTLAQSLPQDLATPPAILRISSPNAGPNVGPNVGMTARGEALYGAVAQAQEWRCSHIVSFELLEDNAHFLADLAKVVKFAEEKPQDIIIGRRDFSKPCPLRLSFERCMSSFWLRVQSGVKVQDVHSSLRAYPLNFFDFVHIQDSGYAFEAESLARALWGHYDVQEIPIHMPSPHTWTPPKVQDYIKLITCNVRLTMRALVPLPFKRRHGHEAEPVSLKRPLQSLRTLMDDPYNRANPKELARTAAIAIAVLTVPAPIIQSVALLLFIGWFRLNRLCALAMIPFTWPPFLPAMAILLGYRVRHGQWLTEFSVQTLGYEAGQRLWEWVIGSLLLTPVFALVAGTVVGSLAYLVARKK